jgi:Ca2+/Na+ antiporter
LAFAGYSAMGPPIAPAESLRIPPAVATSIMFSVAVLYGIALLSTAYSLFRLRPWARTAYLLAAAAFLTIYASLFALIKTRIPAAIVVLVFLVLIVPALWLGWWIINRQFKSASKTAESVA